MSVHTCLVVHIHKSWWRTLNPHVLGNRRLLRWCFARNESYILKLYTLHASCSFSDSHISTHIINHLRRSILACCARLALRWLIRICDVWCFSRILNCLLGNHLALALCIHGRLIIARNFSLRGTSNLVPLNLHSLRDHSSNLMVHFNLIWVRGICHHFVLDYLDQSLWLFNYYDRIIKIQS